MGEDKKIENKKESNSNSDQKQNPNPQQASQQYSLSAQSDPGESIKKSKQTRQAEMAKNFDNSTFKCKIQDDGNVEGGGGAQEKEKKKIRKKRGIEKVEGQIQKKFRLKKTEAGEKGINSDVKKRRAMMKLRQKQDVEQVQILNDGFMYGNYRMSINLTILFCRFCKQQFASDDTLLINTHICQEHPQKCRSSPDQFLHQSNDEVDSDAESAKYAQQTIKPKYYKVKNRKSIACQITQTVMCKQCKMTYNLHFNSTSGMLKHIQSQHMDLMLQNQIHLSHSEGKKLQNQQSLQSLKLDAIKKAISQSSIIYPEPQYKIINKAVQNSNIVKEYLRWVQK